MEDLHDRFTNYFLLLSYAELDTSTYYFLD